VSSSPTPDVTRLLIAWSEGDEAALDRLMPLIYTELHRLAGSHLRRHRRDGDLQTTGLVNEVYLRLIDARQVRWENRAHFFGISARLLRQILVDFARRQGSRKRGDGVRPISLDERLAAEPQPDADLAALDEALCDLSDIDARKARVVELRFFGGLSVEEAAEVLGVSAETVKRDWRLARSWLRQRLSDGVPE
jgi:RNA polymerase sigma factor (TIGR02999 family)